MSNPTPIGQSALSAGQARSPSLAPSAPAPAPTPVPGPTPVGHTSQTAPPLNEPDPAQGAEQRRRNVTNLATLARQALSMNYDTLTCDPRLVADFCVEFERIEGVLRQGGSVAPPDGALDHAREEGRRAAAAEFAEERATLLQRIADMERATPVTVDEMPARKDSFRGPGQLG